MPPSHGPEANALLRSGDPSVFSLIPSPPLRILFVCLGNICRSPAAEGVFTRLIHDAGLADHISVDSAGTLGLHHGQPADTRMSAAATRRGYHLTSRARQITPADLDAFDLILTMDEDNRRNTIALATTPAHRERVRPFCSFCPNHAETEVPDPYYGGPQGFEHVLDLLEDGCAGVLAWAKKHSS